MTYPPAALRGKSILVTGAGRGLGQAAALALGQAGARTIVVDVNPDGAARTAQSIQLAGGQASAHTVDVSNKMAVQTLHYSLLERDERLDGLVNGAHVSPAAAALRLDEWEWNRVLDVNLKGAFLVSQTVARAMRETGGGLILNLVRPAGEHAAVRAAREGLLGLTAVLAVEWEAFGVRVEAVEAAGPEQAAEAVARRFAGFFS